MEVTDLEAVTLLRERLLKKYPEWTDLRFASSGDVPILRLSLPHREDHELSVEVGRTEATVAYSDGLPPGPAEQLFIWNDDQLEEGLDAVCEHIAGLVRGEVLLVREQLSRFTQFVRRHDCDSLLWFVATEDFERWSRRRRRRVQRVWSWDGTQRLAI